MKDAIEYDRHEVIAILRLCGAHLTLDPTTLGAELCMAASKGDVTRLKSYALAGVNLTERDPCGRSALHAATESRNTATVQWLLSNGVSASEENNLGQTPLQIAKLLKNQDLIEILSSAAPEPIAISNGH